MEGDVSYALESPLRALLEFEFPHMESSLTIIPQPVSKIYTSHHHLVKLLSACSPGHNKCKEGILDIAMTPFIKSAATQSRALDALTVDALNLRNRSDITSTESMSWSRKEEKDRESKHRS